MHKTPHAWTTFGHSDVVLRGRSKGICALPKVSKHFQLQPRHYDKLQYTKLHYATLQLQLQLQLQQLLQLQLHYRTVQYTALHYTRLHYTILELQLQLHYTNYTTLHSTPLHYTTLHYIH